MEGGQEHQKALRLYLHRHLKHIGLSINIESIGQNEHSKLSKEREQLLLLCLEKHAQHKILKELVIFESVNLFDHQNYYFFVFALLKKLFPQCNFTNHLQKFTKQSESIENSPRSLIHAPKSQLKGRKKFTTVNFHKLKKYIENKKLYVVLIVFCMFLEHHLHQTFQEKQSAKEIGTYLEFSGPILIMLIQQTENKSVDKNIEIDKQIFEERHFTIKSILVHLEVTHKSSGEHGGAKIEGIAKDHKMKKGSKRDAQPK